ncbi:unnamed protein product [Cyclocybe aegerita]|uniref:HNH nuclease domain-containing protein n=1 Tax=Cyclocybe aegerita TaxID=1973307 RepID=A0A8S0XSI6_CYCAE|nr:unnamed protein product [Cyclocybe aegerita]
MASELQIFTDLSADINRSTLSDADVIAQTKKAKDIIKKLEENTANIFKPSATATSLQLHRVLQAMLTCTEDIKMPPQRLVYVIKAILTCSKRAEEGDRGGPLRHEELVKNLRALAVTWVTHFLFPFKASPRTYAQQASEIFSDIATPTYERTADNMPTRSIGRRTLDMDTVLRRDGYTCVITGIVDSRRPVDPGVTRLEVAHVLRRAVGGQSHRETDPSFRPAAATFDILRNYTRLPDDYLWNMEDHIDHPSNAITLGADAHILFDQYRIRLLPTATEHTYTLDWFDKLRVADFLSGLRKLGGRNLAVVFRNRTPHGYAYNMPDPIFIGIHATVAGVLDISGAAEFIDNLIDKHPPSGSSKPASSWSDMEELISLHEVVTELQRLSVSPITSWIRLLVLSRACPHPTKIQLKLRILPISQVYRTIHSLVHLVNPPLSSSLLHHAPHTQTTTPWQGSKKKAETEDSSSTQRLRTLIPRVFYRRIESGDENSAHSVQPSLLSNLTDGNNRPQKFNSVRDLDIDSSPQLQRRSVNIQC